MLNLLARAISAIFNPYFLIIPIPYFLVLRQTSDPTYAFKWMLFTGFFLFTIGVTVYIAVRRKYFSDLDISRKEQRPLFFLLISVFGVVYLLGLFWFKAPLVLFVAITGIFISLMVLSLITNKVKASIHVASITGLIFSFSILYSGAFLLFLFLIPLIAWARLRMKRHTRSEVLVGASMGFIIPLVIFLIFKVLLHISLS